MSAAPEPQTRSPIAFGAFTLDPYARMLRFGLIDVPLKPKEFDLLALLADASGSLVKKDYIMFSLWEDDDVSEAALSQTVYRLRRILSRYDPRRRYIATIPGRGYQFVQRITEVLT